jgi:long-chain acyl-CoA synthetase
MSATVPLDSIGLAHLLRDRATHTPDRVALMERENVMYAELWSRVLELARSFASLGLGLGDRVAIALPNSSAYVVAYYAAFAAGCVPVALNPAAKSSELARCIQHSGSRLLIAHAENPELQPTLTHCSGIPLLLVDREPSSGSFRLGTSATTLKAPPSSALMRAAGEPNALAALVYTSGTTAEPKAVMLSHRNLVTNVRSVIQSLSLKSDERCLCALPFFYAYGASVLHTHLAVGATLLIEERLAYPARVLDRVARERITSLPLVPAMLPMLFRSGLGNADLSTLRRITLAGAPCHGHEIAKLRGLLPRVEIFLMYGQTEATARLCCAPAMDLVRREGSVGRPVPGVELQVRDGAGQPVPPGEVGEVFARGPNVMIGYYRDPRATAAVLDEGWLRTGDLGSLDSDGFLYLRGRRTDIIKTGAHRISPGEIEEIIAELEGVEDSAVVGTPDAVLGQAVIAYVQRAGGSSVSAEEVHRHCRARLSLHKLPRRIEFVSELPKTASGKVQRASLLPSHARPAPLATEDVA